MSIDSFNVLPPNFDKYTNIINYFKNNGIDCLLTKYEKFRFYIVYIYSKEKRHLHSDFYKELKMVTNLTNRDNPRWGRWSDPDYDTNYFYNINEFTFFMPGYIEFNMDEKFLDTQLSKVSDVAIECYFNDLHNYGKLNTIMYVENNITITNNFNESKIVVKKEYFRKYVGYQDILNDYKNEKIKSFSINVLFNDKVANDISDLLNEKQQKNTHYTIDELEQKINVIDFLQINLNYDHIKL